MRCAIKNLIYMVFLWSFAFCGLENLTLDEKLGQLIVAPACPERIDERHLRDLQDLKNKWYIGGFLLKQGTLKQTSALILSLQADAQIPLLIAADAEWGLTMRISDALRYPRNMTLGAVQDLNLLEQIGWEIGKQMRQLGFHLNLAPVVDVNSNPKNPIIYTRSFGDDPQEVAARGLRVMTGMQTAGIMACAKHFPGHGDTFVDSHVALPCVAKEFSEIEKLELIPFKTLIDHGVAFVMTAHLIIPKVDDQPVTLSKKWVSEILRKQLGFQGLIITDALNMAGIAKERDPGEVAIAAFLAGHDLLLYGDHIAPKIDEIMEETIPAVLNALKKAVEEGVIAEEEIDRRVERILKAKEKLSLTSEIIESPSSLPSKLFAEALTQLGTLPKLKVASVVQIGPGRQIDRLLMEKGVEIRDDAPWKVVVVGEIEREVGEKKEAVLKALQELKNYKGKAVVVLFASPYNLIHIPKGIPVLIGYEEAPEAWEAAAAALAGEISCHGCLPIRYY